MKKLFVLSIFTALISVYDAVGQMSNTWQLYANQNDVSIYFKYDDCKIPSQGFNQSWVYIKIQNTSSQTKIVSWHYDLYYNEICRTCGNNEYNVSFQLTPGEVKEGACALGRKELLNIFVKHLDLPNKEVLTDFKLTDITVK